jgi:hypothetical protein
MGGMDLANDPTGGKEMASETAGHIIVHGWNCQCGSCGYGGGSWVDSPAKRDNPIIVQDTESCPGCGVVFTGTIPMDENG